MFNSDMTAALIGELTFVELSTIFYSMTRQERREFKHSFIRYLDRSRKVAQRVGDDEKYWLSFTRGTLRRVPKGRIIDIFATSPSSLCCCMESGRNLSFFNMPFTHQIEGEPYGIPFPNRRHLLAKSLVELPLRVNTETDDIVIVAYDIECFSRTPTDEVVEWYHPEGRLGMISEVMAKPSGEIISKTIFSLLRPGKSPMENIEGVEVHEYEDESDLALSFLESIKEKSANRLLLAIGFNSSASLFDRGEGEPMMKCGYDLPFILSRITKTSDDRKRLNVLMGSVKWAGQPRSCIYRTALTGARVLFLDVAPIVESAHDTLSRTGKHQPISGRRNLDAFAQVFGVGGKENSGLSYAQIGSIMRTREEEMVEDSDGIHAKGYTDVAKYCLIDSELCIRLIVASGYLHQRDALSRRLGVPLTLTMTLSDAGCINIALAKEAYRVGIPFNYAFSEKGNKFKGALNVLDKGREEELVAMGDYRSLYPSVMITHNISPETFRGVFIDPQPDCYNIPNDPDEQVKVGMTEDSPFDKEVSSLIGTEGKCYMAFDQQNGKDGLVSGWVRKQLIDRVRMAGEVKRLAAITSPTPEDRRQKEWLDLQVYVVKILINSSYGLLGSPSSCYLFRKECAMAVTLGARRALFAAIHSIQREGLTVLYGDTDSAAFSLPQLANITNKAERQDEISRVMSSIQHSILPIIGDRAAYPLDPEMREKGQPVQLFQFENLFDKMVMLFKAKSYVTLQGGKMKLKGVQTRNMSPPCTERMMKMIEQVFTLPQEARQKEIEAFLRSEMERVKNPEHWWEYATRVKMSSRAPVKASLQSRYPLLFGGVLDSIMVLPGRSLLAKTKSERMFPIGREVEERGYTIPAKVDEVEAVRRMYGSNLTKFLDRVYVAAIRNLSKGHHSRVLTYGNVDYSNTLKLQVRIEKPGNGKVLRQAPRGFSIEKLTSYIDNNPTHSLHEMICDSFIRLGFDLDSGQSFDIKPLIHDIRTFARVNGHAKVAIYTLRADAPERAKYSAHIITNLRIHINHARWVATCWKARYPFIDAGIYNLGHSLRIPLVPKICEDGTVDERRFALSSEGDTRASLPDLLLTYLNNTHPLVSILHVTSAVPGILLSDMDVGDIPAPLLIQVASHFQLPPDMLGVSPYTSSHEVGWRVQVGKEHVSLCPMCQRKHGRQFTMWKVIRVDRDEYKYGCFLRPEGTPMHSWKRVGSTGGKVRDKIKDFISTLSPNTAPNERVSFRLGGRLTLVKAPLGSGKTHQLLDEMDRLQPKVVVSLSPRRTFSSAMSARCNLADYRDVKGVIDLSKVPRVIIQVDSIARLNVNHVAAIDLLIIDEVESILSQMTSVSKKTRDLPTGLISLIHRSRTVVAMDALLTTATSQVLSALVGTSDEDIHEVEHSASPLMGYRVKVKHGVLNSLGDKGRVVTEVLTRLADGPVVCSIGSRNLAEEIREEVGRTGKNAMIIHGENLALMDGGVSMGRLKEEWLKDIEGAILSSQPDILLYTSTLTAGVSIDIDYFHSAIHVITPDYSSPIDSMQSLLRVRSVRSKEMTLFIMASRMHQVEGWSQAFDALQRDPVQVDIGDQVRAWMLKRATEFDAYGWRLCLEELSNMGAQLEFDEEPAEKKAEMEKRLARMKEERKRRSIETPITPSGLRALWEGKDDDRKVYMKDDLEPNLPDMKERFQVALSLYMLEGGLSDEVCERIVNIINAVPASALYRLRKGKGIIRAAKTHTNLTEVPLEKRVERALQILDGIGEGKDAAQVLSNLNSVLKEASTTQQMDRRMKRLTNRPTEGKIISTKNSITLAECHREILNQVRAKMDGRGRMLLSEAEISIPQKTLNIIRSEGIHEHVRKDVGAPLLRSFFLSQASPLSIEKVKTRTQIDGTRKRAAEVYIVLNE